MAHVSDHWLTWLAAYLTALALLSIGAGFHERYQWKKENPAMAGDDVKHFYEAMRKPLWWCLFAFVMFALLMCLVVSGSHARDLDGRYASSPLKPWFDALRSSGGSLCCSDADGTALSDVDWESKDGKYRVRIGGEWIDVPDDAVITVPNRAGRTMVWPYYMQGHAVVRCFMPGSMT